MLAVEDGHKPCRRPLHHIFTSCHHLPHRKSVVLLANKPWQRKSYFSPLRRHANSCGVLTALLLCCLGAILAPPDVRTRITSMYYCVQPFCPAKVQAAIAHNHHSSLAASTPRVFYISETPVGGSLKYIQDLIAHYGGGLHGVGFHRLSNQAAASKAASLYRHGDILLFQYLLNTDFTFAAVAELVQRFHLRLVIPIHDKYFLNDDPAADYSYHPSLHIAEAATIAPDKRKLLQVAEYLIFPSRFIYQVFRKYLDLPSMVIIPHLDHPLHLHLRVPPLDDDAFHVGIITSPTYYKGVDLWESLLHIIEHQGKRVVFYVYSIYHNPRFPNVVVRGPYQEGDIYTKLEQDGIHGLLFLNRYPETYSYALTKGINSGRPLLYTNMGAVAERLGQLNRGDRYVATDNTDLEDKFRVLLDYIAVHAGVGAAAAEDEMARLRLIHDSPFVTPAFYDHLFGGAEQLAITEQDNK